MEDQNPEEKKAEQKIPDKKALTTKHAIPFSIWHQFEDADLKKHITTIVDVAEETDPLVRRIGLEIAYRCVQRINSVDSKFRRSAKDKPLLTRAERTCFVNAQYVLDRLINEHEKEVMEIIRNDYFRNKNNELEKPEE